MAKFDDKDRRRELRREHKKRIGKKTFKRIYGFDPDGPIPTKENSQPYIRDFEPEKIAGILGDTQKRCSCTCCGNPRKHYDEETIQEKRAPEIDEFEWVCDECIGEEREITEEEKEACEYGIKMGYIVNSNFRKEN